VVLHIGQPARAGDVTIEFARVVEDSRCPASVDCVWSGQVVVELQVTPPGGAPEALQLKLLGKGMRLDDTMTLGGHTFQLLSVTPYPATPDGIAPAAYEVTVRVTES
jgi:hypothetical protein